MKKTTFIPLALFGVLVVFLAIGLTRDPREIPSPLIDKPAPSFDAAVLGGKGLRMGTSDMAGKVWLLNGFASWCVACREEHPVLMEFAKRKIIPIVGLDYRDKDADATRWLERFGNPYDVVISDPDARIGIDFGIYGVPESFLIDKAGVIRYKQIGPITPQALNEKIIPLIQELQK